MSEGRRVFITLIIAFSASLSFALISHFGLLSVIENSFYKPMVVKELEEFNDSLAQTVGKYIDTQDALFTLFAANPELQAVTQKDQDELLIQTRATLASDLLTETPGLEGLRIIGENGKTIYYSTFPQDFAARKGDEPAAYRNYPKNDIDFNTIAVSEGTKSRIFSDSENNRLIFSYPFYDNEMLFIGTIAFYVDAPSMLRYFIPTDRLMAQSSIHLWNSLKNEAHGFVFSVPENLETVCKNAAISSWNSKQKINSFEGTNGQNNNYLLISAENQNGFVSTVFNENVMHMPERTQRVIVLATIGLIFFISIICCIAKNAAVRHAESPKKAEEKEDKKLAEAAAEEVPVRIAEHEKSEPLMERFEDVF
ncbi:MAG: PDC sensor domain-containing protein, partial [Treponemataceae bacterium]|nr:PDC sensor domain-containing protein [Treponemataceae bacterium]